MNRRIREKDPVPTDGEILALDNVPVDVTARYLGWTEQNVRLALREARAPFGIAIPGNKGALTYKISPGGARLSRELPVAAQGADTADTVFEVLGGCK